ncbi:DUF2497 domain-containing protein [Pseudovibrio sp. Tun.PSC04-5.I4]|uniref:PopZ family protein n=1 Tax=Pseudovibrio sp. Tun.PSC04-5.I4 TaxID=1798213 RepID=UPI000889C003|nr:DUF2497 domain-containing protein [Pseudovibrio sp. Tun.PSC04-5.I4]SDR09402.1 hypothetical protein SAMN04515695_2724 [Pseudovibrio sp. Tun.PSC04-5.I4]
MGAVSQGNEPSMEDILSSIRKIISDDETSGAEQMADAAMSEEDAGRELSQDDLDKLFDDAPGMPEPAPKPVKIEEPEDVDVLELTQEEKVDEKSPSLKIVEGLADEDREDSGDIAFLEEDSSDAFGMGLGAESTSAFSAMSSSLQDGLLGSARSAGETQGETLISSATDQVVSSAFNGLANTVLSKNARTLEDLVAEMLRPMLKGWLDQHLPTVVERLVRQEIDRISRK